MKRRILIFSAACMLAAAVMVSGCSEKKDSVENSSQTEESSEPSGTSGSAPLINTPEEGQENPEQMGEGAAPTDIPEESRSSEAELGEPLIFSEDGRELYSVTLEQAEFTDRRAVAETEAPEKVLLFTYSYESLSGEAVLVDDMSFRCLDSGGEACTPYYLADQLVPEVNQGGEPARAEIAFRVPEDMEQARIYVVNNSNPEGESYQVTVQP